MTAQIDRRLMLQEAAPTNEGVNRAAIYSLIGPNAGTVIIRDIANGNLIGNISFRGSEEHCVLVERSHGVSRGGGETYNYRLLDRGNGDNLVPLPPNPYLSADIPSHDILQQQKPYSNFITHVRGEVEGKQTDLGWNDLTASELVLASCGSIYKAASLILLAVEKSNSSFEDDDHEGAQAYAETARILTLVAKIALSEVDDPC